MIVEAAAMLYVCSAGVRRKISAYTLFMITGVVHSANFIDLEGAERVK